MNFSTAIQQMVAIARAVSFEARSSSWTSRPPRSTSARSRVLFDVIRQLKARRRRGHLRQPQARRALRRLRPGHRSCATGAPCAVGPMAEIDQAASSSPPCSGAIWRTVAGQGATGLRRGRQRDRRANCSTRPTICASAAGCATSPSTSQRARSSAWPACSAPAAPRRRGRSSAPTSRKAGTVALRRQADRLRRARPTPSRPASASARRTARSRASCPTCPCART